MKENEVTKKLIHALKTSNENVKGKRKPKLRIATSNKRGANQELHKKLLDIKACLHKYNIDYLGVTKANLKIEADMNKVEIQGYILVWDAGREHPQKRNARVVVYIKRRIKL